MATQNETLVFRADDQSLWTDADIPTFEFTTGDALIFSIPEVTKDFDFDIEVAGVSGTFFADFEFGLRAYATLGKVGTFDAGYTFNVAVDHTSGVDLSNTAVGTDVEFDFTDWELKEAELVSTGIDIAPKAGLDLVFGAKMGVRDGEAFGFGFSDDFDIEFFDEEHTVAIFELDPQLKTDASGGGAGIEWELELPTGVDTENRRTDGEFKLDKTVRAEDPFAELKGSITDAVGTLLGELPVIGPAFDVIFADFDIDLGEELTGDAADIIPEGAFEFELKGVTAGGSIQAHVQETIGIDVQNTVVPVNIVLRSDNGTPGDFSDDVVETTTLGNIATLDVGNTVLGTTGPSQGLATNTVTALYDLDAVDYNHSFDVVLSAKFGIEILKASFDGDWVPDALAFKFGPLFELSIPEGEDREDIAKINVVDDAFTLREGAFINAPSSGTNPNSWGYEQGAFNQISRDYEIFIVDNAPLGFNPDSSNAVQEIYEFRELLEENTAAAIAEFQFLQDNVNQTITTFSGASFNEVDLSITGQSRLWDGTLTGEVAFDDDPASQNFVFIKPVFQSGGGNNQGLRVDLILNDGSPDFNDPLLIGTNSGQQGVGVDSNDTRKLAILNNLGDPLNETTAIVYHSVSDTIKSVNPVSIIGTGFDDVLVRHGDGNRLFDGSGALDNDLFIADFSVTHPNTSIIFDTSPGSNFEAGILLGGDTHVRNVESFIIRTGDANDTVASGESSDHLETGGGQDQILLLEDTLAFANIDIGNKDTIKAGAGDDVILVRNPDINQNDLTLSGIDDVFGGAGTDLAVYEVVAPAGLDDSQARLIVGSFITVDRGSTDPQGIQAGFSSNVGTLFEVLEHHDGGNFGKSDIPTDRDANSADGFLEFIGAAGTVRFFDDVESISIIGSDYASDAALFTGGLTYKGGAGFTPDPNNQGTAPVANEDLLVADFGAYAAGFGVTSGITVVAEDRLLEDGTPNPDQEVKLSFGDATIDGFERIVARGTDFNDFFLGGKFSDGFDGGLGNDVIDGGEFEPFLDATLLAAFEVSDRTFFEETISINRDVLVGGLGADQFIWSDDGADKIEGEIGINQANGANLGASDGDQLIVMAEADSQGLEYGFFDPGLGVTFQGAGVIPDRLEFDANSTSQQILSAMGMFGDRVHEDTSAGGPDFFFAFGNGLRFGDTLNAPNDVDPWLDYRGIEQVNIIASDAADDLLIYENGATYIAGERQDGTDRDTFAADFSAQGSSITYIGDDIETTGVLLGNGAFVQGAERHIILAGTRADILVGGNENDHLDGGAGDDIIYGGDEFPSLDGLGDDIIRGGAGDDTVLWYTDGTDNAQGGDGFDTLVLASRGAQFRWDSFDANGTQINFDLTAADAFAEFETVFNAFPTIAEHNLFISSNVPGGGNHQIRFSEFESVNMAGSNEFDDVGMLIGGSVIYGGDRVGDADVLLANLATEIKDLIVTADGRDDVGPSGTASEFDENGEFIGDFAGLTDIGNGMNVGGFERLHFGGGSGDDILTGGTLVDVLIGGAGQDQLNGGGGGSVTVRDQADGGDGDDTLTFSSGHAFYDGGETPSPNDRDLLQVDVDVEALTSGITLTVLDDNGATLGGGTFTAASTARADLTNLFDFVPSRAGVRNGTQDADALRMDFDSDSLIHRNFEDATFVGSALDDILVMPIRSGVAFGEGGDDLLVSGIGLDILVGGAGVDTYAYDSANGGFGTDTIALEDHQGAILYFNDKSQGDITFTAENGDDLKLTTSGGTILVKEYFAAGGNGLDFTFDFLDFTGKIDLSGLASIVPGGAPPAGFTVDGTSASDDLSGLNSINNDLYRAKSADDLILASAGADFIDGAEGTDIVSYLDNATGGVTVDLAFSRGTGGIAAGDTLIDIENILGTNFGDFLAGDHYANLFLGADGNDIVNARAGDDIAFGGEGNDRLLGAAGQDRLFGEDGDDDLEGGDNNDRLSGGRGEDTLEGQGGDDILIGGGAGVGGEESVFGGGGNDTYFHGGFDDAATAGSTDENGRFTFTGGADTDRLDLSNYEFAVFVNESNIDAVFTGFTGDIQGAPINIVGFMIGVEAVTGTDFDDLFRDNGEGFTFAGGLGNDRFFLDDGDGGVPIAGDYDGGTGVDTIEDQRDGGNGLRVNLSGNTEFVNLTGTIETLDAGTFKDSDGITHSVANIENVNGTNAVDVFIGGDEDNVFSDSGGGDIIEANGGDDTVIAHVGEVVVDNYLGGLGLDKVDYSAATNGIFINVPAGQAIDRPGFGTASIGDDNISSIEHIVTGSGDDLVFGSNNNIDMIFELGAGSDTIFGGAGNERIIGGLGDDDFSGGGQQPNGGFDVLDYSRIAQGITLDLTLLTGQATGAGIGTDTISGFERIIAGQGDDDFTGDANGNFFMYQAAAGGGGRDAYSGGGGLDIVDFSEFKAAITFDQQAISQQVITNDLVNSEAAGATRIIADLTDIDAVIATEFADTIRGSDAVADVLEGQGGDDTLVGRDGADEFFGGSGRDTADYTLETGTANNADGRVVIDLTGTLIGHVGAIDSFGNDDLFDNVENARGSGGADTIIGDNGANRLEGGAGGDVIMGVGGDNQLFGQAGDDVITGGIASDRIEGGFGSDTANSGEGNDLLIFTEDAGDRTDLDTWNGGAGTDTGDFSTFHSAVQIDVNATHEAFTRDSANLSAGSGPWRIIAEIDEVEHFIGTDFQDKLFGGAGKNILLGGAGNDVLLGRDGDDSLAGGAGVDRINGAAGADVMEGGDGSDVYTVETIGDTVTEAKGAAAGTADRINTWINFTNAENVEFLVGKFAAVGLTLNGNSGNDRITGANKINSGDTINGHDGADRLVGLVGNDNISGGKGNDRIFGNSGDDVIQGGAGRDVLTGQQGSDTFVHGLGDEMDFITDFNVAADKLDLTAHEFADFTAVQAILSDTASGARFDLGIAGAVVLIGVDANTIGTEDVLI